MIVDAWQFTGQTGQWSYLGAWDTSKEEGGATRLVAESGPRLYYVRVQYPPPGAGWPAQLQYWVRSAVPPYPWVTPPWVASPPRESGLEALVDEWSGAAGGGSWWFFAPTRGGG